MQPEPIDLVRREHRNGTSGEPERYLLFAGPHFSAGSGPAPLVGAFSDERQARQAFASQRLSDTGPAAWGQLVAVDASGRVTILGWFGPSPGRCPDQPYATQAISDDVPVVELETERPGRQRSASRSRSRKGRGRRRRRAVALAVLVVACSSGLRACRDATPSPRPSEVSHAPAPGFVPGALIGHEAIGMRSEAYGPGTSRTWPVSEGLHQVTVLAGTLSVEDDSGGRWDYPAGGSYVAGWAPYRATNLTAAPVQVAVTYLGRP